METLGADSIDDLSESMLIRDGFFCGWRFDAGNVEAIWFVEECEIKFLNGSGSVVQVTDLSQELVESQIRRAA